MTEGSAEAILSLVSLLVIRLGAALRLCPFLGGKPLGLLPWAGVSVALACVLAPHSGPWHGATIGSPAWFLTAVKELFIGVVIGALARIAFSVLEVAGDLARIETLATPAVGTDNSARGAPLTQAYVLLGTAAFLLVGGHRAFIIALAKTTRCLPPGEIPGFHSLASAGIPGALELFSLAMATGVLISAPVFVAGIAADLVIGLVSRFAPGVTPTSGTQALRALFVQVMVIVALGTVVSAALHFLQIGMEKLDLCIPPTP